MPNAITFVWSRALGVVRALRGAWKFLQSGLHRTDHFVSRMALETVNLFAVAAIVFGAGAVAEPLIAAANLPVERARWIMLAVTCLIAGIAITIYFSAQRSAPAMRWQRLQFRLEQRALLDAAHGAYVVNMKPASDYAAWNFINQFAAIPNSASEVMILLRQTRKRKWKRHAPYSLKSLQTQIEELDTQIIAGKIKAPIRWVCFTDRDGRFVAYQHVVWFVREMNAGNQEYETVLCLRDPEDFRNKILGNRTLDIRQKLGKVTAPNTLPELRPVCIPSHLTRREAVIYMLRKDEPNAMLVEDRKPIAVLELQQLMDGMFDEDVASTAEQVELVNRIDLWRDQFWNEKPSQAASLDDARSATEHDDDNPLKEASIASHDEDGDDDFRPPRRDSERNSRAA